MIFTIASATMIASVLALGGQQDGELVAAEAREHVGLAQAAAQRAGDVTISSSPAAWPSLSLIALKWSRSSTSSAPSARSARRVRRAGPARARTAAVEQPGERVVVGHVAQLGLEAAALGDVLDLGEHVERRAVGVAHHVRAARPTPGARGVDDAQLGGLAVAAAAWRRPRP